MCKVRGRDLRFGNGLKECRCCGGRNQVCIGSESVVLECAICGDHLCVWQAPHEAVSEGPGPAQADDSDVFTSATNLRLII